ncbi:hypothetical protein ACIBCN_41410 [Nocardia sp. NPDC051052]|uniref:hypothetical protein n=1 Tax=Nocardia sp. NPDC051052 TaxID=3364322 RepID=UPI00379C63F3
MAVADICFIETGIEDLLVSFREINWWSRVATKSVFGLSVIFVDRAISQLAEPEVRRLYSEALQTVSVQVLVRSEIDAVQARVSTTACSFQVIGIDEFAEILMDKGRHSVWH